MAGGSKVSTLTLISLGLVAATAVTQGSCPELSYFGRASVKIVTSSGLVIYIDPYAPGDYSQAADLVLVTHGHGDHNQVKLVPLKANSLVASPAGAVSVSGAKVVAEGDRFEVAGGAITVTVLPASNGHHSRLECVGYLLSFDGIVLYHAGDTSYLAEMEGYANYKIDYALLPCDGFYNMGAAEAARCAKAMRARRVIPIHSDKDGLFDEKNARAVGGPGLLVLKPGDETRLGDSN